MVKRLRNVRTIILTGLSGSGKSTALKALEDAGFFCVDNLPVDLLPRFLELRERGSPEAMKVALVMDVRERDFLKKYPLIFDELDKAGFILEIVFLEASTDVLIRRFSQTRRIHPFAGDDSVREAVIRERQALAGLRGRAEMVIDTTALSVHDLESLMVKKLSGPMAQKRMHVDLISFGFKYGLPHEADIVIDVRFLPNPYFVDGLRQKDGLSGEVKGFLERFEETERFLERFSELLTYLLPLYEKEGKAYLSVAVGCTGGRHRSVVVVEELKKQLDTAGYQLAVRHRDVNLG